jgi:enoyl-CoA hydratase/carnithine racemase
VAQVRVETSQAGVRTVCIDREPRRNALDRATLAELEAAFDAASADARVRVLVLRGAGDRAFCAGADLTEVRGHASIDESREHFGLVGRAIEAMQRAPVPVIARVAGYALAGGCGLAAAADLTIAAQSARFGLPEIAIGLLPLMVSAPIYRALGSRNALLDLVLTGREVAAEEARELGLATRVVSDGELDREVAALCERFVSLSPAALRLGKEAVYAMCEMETGAAMRYLREMIVLVSRTEDAQEGIAAFFEKRRPAWKGR